MGVVRREGPWRLEKRERGVYEITYDKEPQEVIITSKGPDRRMGRQFGIGRPVHRVDTYAEAEGLFEERARGSPGAGLGPAETRGISIGGNQSSKPIDLGGFEEDLEDVNLPPGAIALVLIIAGAIFIGSGAYSSFESLSFLLPAVMILVGMSIIAWTFFTHDSPVDAIRALGTVDESEEPSSNSNSDGLLDQLGVPPTGSTDEMKSALQKMDDYEFEKFVADLWELEGWKTDVSRQSGDEGIDIVAERTGAVEHKLLIQAKRYQEGNKVGPSYIREYNSLTDQERDADAVAVVTSSSFTKGAQEMGERLNVKLVDGDSLAAMLEKHEAEEMVIDTVDSD